MNYENIRPSADLRNHYSEISRYCHEEETPVIITVNGRGDTAVLSLQYYNQMRAELDLLRALADSEEDVLNGRVAPVKDTFDSIRSTLLAKNDKDRL